MEAPSDHALECTYENWRRKGSADCHWATQFWAPMLIAKPHDWDTSVHRVAIVGQETGKFGAWTELDGQDLLTLAQFFARTDAVSTLQDSQERFLADHKPSPFFQYFQKIQSQLASAGESVSAVWTNVIRCASAGPAGYRLFTVRQPDNGQFREWQKGLLREELRILKPTLIVFLSGPDYDQYLDQEFASLQHEELSGFSVRQVAKLASPELPAPAYRTYHPNYLARSGLAFAPLRAALLDYARSGRRTAC